MKTVRVACWIWLACALAACSSDKKLELGGTCTLNSDCTSPLLCKLGSCRKACVRSIDCDNGGRCVTVDGVAVCQTQAESACGADQTCPTGLVCRTVDNTCRTPCSPTNDTSCVAGQTCSGTLCLENSEVANPGTDAGAGAGDGAAGADAASVADATAGPDAGAAGPDLPVAPPDAAAPDVPLATSDAASADVSLAKPDAAADAPASSADSAVAADISGGAKPDTSPSTVCSPACTVGQACVSGNCQPCGRSVGQVCCAGTCNANLTCNAMNQCACGDQDQACCSGTTCSAELACVGGTCTCGEFGSACCTGKTCNHSGACAGTRCTCLQACEPAWYQKIDGTIGRKEDPTFRLLASDGSVFADPAARMTGETAGSNWLVCVVPSDGSVWCAGTNQNGALGTGDTALTSSSKLVRVLTGVGGSPLAAIKKVEVYDGSGTWPAACALSLAGKIWCWGTGSSGQLGTGFLAGSSFAVPVLAAPGGPNFADAVDVTVGDRSSCAVKADGSAWCWGRNYYGTLGTGDYTDTAIPKQVINLDGHQITAIDSENAGTCAIDNDGYVWCWGYYSYVGPDGNGSTNSNVPIRLVMSKGGAAFQDAVYVNAGRAMKRDGSIWEWGPGAAIAPQPVVRNGVAVTSPYFMGRYCWIGADGNMYNGSSVSPTAVTCP